MHKISFSVGAWLSGRANQYNTRHSEQKALFEIAEMRRCHESSVMSPSADLIFVSCLRALCISFFRLKDPLERLNNRKHLIISMNAKALKTLIPKPTTTSFTLLCLLVSFSLCLVRFQHQISKDRCSKSYTLDAHSIQFFGLVQCWFVKMALKHEHALFQLVCVPITVAAVWLWLMLTLQMWKNEILHKRKVTSRQRE